MVLGSRRLSDTIHLFTSFWNIVTRVIWRALSRTTKLSPKALFATLFTRLVPVDFKLDFILAAGLEALRMSNIVHRDLKPHNILLAKRGNQYTLKIADFGLARAMMPTDLAHTMCGSPLYMVCVLLLCVRSRHLKS